MHAGAALHQDGPPPRIDGFEAIGQQRADTSILLAQFDWTGTTMPDLARRIVDAAEDLYDRGVANAAEVGV